jgi:NAD(P)-dependent dehydrogenase (short-subunit alcohol dehydrogenase family)
MATGGVTSVYVGSKHAVEGITKSVALEIANSGSSGALPHATSGLPRA